MDNIQTGQIPKIVLSKDYFETEKSLIEHYDCLQAILDRSDKLSTEDQVKHKKYIDKIKARLRITLEYIANINTIVGD